MTIRQDDSIEIELNEIDRINDKISIRSFLLNRWILEEPNLKYRYFVETLVDGNRIYLERPGRLNKGCDFVIYIENHIVWKNRNDKPPAHEFIITDLYMKKNALSCLEWNLLLAGIESIYSCTPFYVAYTNCNHLPVVGEPYELILKTLRWLFIEQDITYWSGSGRSMLYNGIMEI